MAKNPARTAELTSAATHPGTPGVISSFDTYTLREAKARLGWTDSAYRAARRRGLAVMKDGKRAYIAGQAIQRYLEDVSRRASDV